MDTTSIAIIIIATVTAVAFKWFLYRRIKAWMLQDYIKGLAGGDAQKMTELAAKAEQLQKQGLKGQALLDELSGHAREF